MKFILKIKYWFNNRIPSGALSRILFSSNISDNKTNIIYYSGALSIFFLLLQILTGSLLSLYYKPNIEDAYASIQYINNNVEFGNFIRSIHYWTSHVLIISSIIYLLSKFFLKAYRKPNELLWFSSLFLFLIFLVFAFSGQTLPWTDLSYFGTVIGISQTEKIPFAGHFIAEIITGRAFAGNDTLGRLYSLHTIVLPVFVFIIFILHFTVKILLNVNHDNKTNDYAGERNILINKTIMLMLSGLAVISSISIILPKGLGLAYDINNPAGAPTGIHPEWYFMWLYQILKADGFLPGEIINLILIILIAIWFAVPFLENKFSNGKNNKLVRNSGIIFISLIVLMTIWGYLNAGFSGFEIAATQSIATGGIDKSSFLGVILFTIFIFIFLLYLRSKTSNKR